MKSKFLSVWLIVTLIFFILSFSIALPIYCRFFYFLQIKPLGLTQIEIPSVGRALTYKEIVTAFNDLLNYLNFGASFKTGILEYTDLEIRHFEDVKYLFNLDTIILIMTIGFLSVIYVLTKKGSQWKLYQFKRTPFFYAGAIILVTTVILVFLVSLNFERAFLVFHEIFFYNKSEYFFSSSEEIIFLLPEAFFMNCAILIGSSIITLSVVCILIDISLIKKQKKAPIKLVAIDIDGTLLNSKKELTQANIEAIKAASALGVYVVISSGRPYQGIVPLLTKLDLLNEKNYTIAFNGAIVVNNATGDAIIDYPLTKQDILILNKLAKDLDIHSQGFIDRKCYTEYANAYSQLEATLNHIEVNLINYEELEDSCIVNKFMWADEPEKLKKAYELIPEEIFETYCVVFSAPHFLEFLNPKTNKGNALKELAGLLEIEDYEVMAIGDEENDLSMLKYAKIKVAMENAGEHIKKTSNYITASNDEEGVAKAINKFILNKGE